MSDERQNRPRPDIQAITGVSFGGHDWDDLRELMRTTVAAVQAGDLSAITGWMQPERVQRLRAMAAAHGDEVGHWLAMLSDVRGGRSRADDVRRAIRQSPSEEIAAPVARGDIAEDLPETWADPNGYVCTAGGLYRETDSGSYRITSRPIWIDQYLSEVNGGGDALRICWRSFGGGVARRIVPRAVAASARDLVGELATHGASITSASAGDVVRYLDEATTKNEKLIPRRDVSGRLGWIYRDGAPRGFLAGADYIGRPGDPGVDLMADDGVSSLAASYGTRGTWDGYLTEVVGPASSSAAFWLSTYNQIASVLVRPLDLGAPWFIDRSGRTSQGKSTIGKAAAAVWQDPRAVPSWNTSKAGVEARAATLRDLPLMLDDSKEARRPDDVAAVVYMHGNGTGAIRGKPGSGGRAVGLRATERWSSAGDSSGEQRLTSFTNDAGARARVLCLIGSPLASGEVARRVQLGAEHHYGHLGRRVVRYLLGLDLGQLRQRFEQEHAWARHELVEDGAVALRLGRIVGALRLAASLVHAVGVPEPEADVWGAALKSCRHGSEDADQPLAALRYIMQRCASERARFWHSGCERPASAYGDEEDSLYRAVPGGYAGRWSLQNVDILQCVVEEWLKRGGYDNGTIERWHESGYIVTTSSSRKHTVRCRIAGSQSSVYRIPVAMFDKHA